MTPTIFIGHGSPMNAIEENDFTQTLKRLGSELEKPKAILCVSAHWMTEGTWITHMQQPRTIHDFYGFPQPLFDVQYPAPSSPEIAEQITAKIRVPAIHLDNELWGYDHGTWSVLRHMYPNADVPVMQLSLNIAKPASYHFELGQQLRKLRGEGILILGSGNIVHNLRRIQWDPNAPAYDWAIEFDDWAARKMIARDFHPLVNDYLKSEAGQLSAPTPDHYFPFVSVLGASDEREQMKFVYEGMQNASISMRAVQFG